MNKDIRNSRFGSFANVRSSLVFTCSRRQSLADKTQDRGFWKVSTRHAWARAPRSGGAFGNRLRVRLRLALDPGACVGRRLYQQKQRGLTRADGVDVYPAAMI